MPTEHTSGKPTTRRYSVEEKQAAVRMVRSLQAETGQSFGAVKRVAGQLGYGVESVRAWVKQAEQSNPTLLAQRDGCGSLSRRTVSCAERTRF